MGELRRCKAINLKHTCMEAGSLKQHQTYILRLRLCTRDVETESHLLWFTHLFSGKMTALLEVFITVLEEAFITSLDYYLPV